MALPVWGMTETEKLSASTLATVRLMPSMATEPFSTIRRRTGCSARIVTQTALSSFVSLVTVPVPSMWPLTICPPNLPSAGMARSRLTRLPGTSVPRDERRIVSAITSAVKLPVVIFVAVRQTPFTAMLSPTLLPSVTVLQATVSLADFSPCLISLISPISSMIPVNIYISLLL